MNILDAINKMNKLYDELGNIKLNVYAKTKNKGLYNCKIVDISTDDFNAIIDIEFTDENILIPEKTN